MAYLFHYQALLIYPAVAGMFVTAYSCTLLAFTGDISKSFDTRVNGIYGLVVPIWGAFFIQSWIRKQRTLEFIWNLTAQSLKKDERVEEFSFYEYYN